MSSSSITLSSSVRSLNHQGVRLALTAVAVGATVMLAACGGGSKAGATQVAAKVNKEEISVHQINYVLQRQPGIKPEMVPAASKRILEGLIDQELAIQQAVEQKVDRDPKVVSAIEAARRDIIARAYADRVAESAAKPTPEEIKAYYAAKPALFAQRRIYSLNEFVIEVAADQRDALAGKLQNLKSPDELAGALRSAGIKFANRAAQQTPENLPLAMVDRIATLGEGQSFAIPSPTGLVVVFIAAAKPAAVTEEAARPAIEQYLLNDRKRQLVADEVKRLRGAAKIEYKGQFADAPAGAASGVDAPSVAPTAPAASQ
jgi:EpsD family peptidyl-prolyl cis-trans isomerase